MCISALSRSDDLAGGNEKMRQIKFLWSLGHLLQIKKYPQIVRYEKIKIIVHLIQLQCHLHVALRISFFPFNLFSGSHPAFLNRLRGLHFGDIQAEALGSLLQCFFIKGHSIPEHSGSVMLLFKLILSSYFLLGSHISLVQFFFACKASMA